MASKKKHQPPKPATARKAAKPVLRWAVIFPPEFSRQQARDMAAMAQGAKVKRVEVRR